MVQWLGLHASTAGGPGSIPGRGTKITRKPRGVATKKKKKNQTSDILKRTVRFSR